MQQYILNNCIEHLFNVSGIGKGPLIAIKLARGVGMNII